MNLLSDKYRKIGESVREELFPELQGLRIAWLASDKAPKKKNLFTNADCRRVSPQYEWCCDYDYIITVYEPNASYMTDDQLRILLEHELMHIDFDGEKMGIKPHDSEEFIAIIRKYGIDWAMPDKYQKTDEEE